MAQTKQTAGRTTSGYAKPAQLSGHKRLCDICINIPESIATHLGTHEISFKCPACHEKEEHTAHSKPMPYFHMKAFTQIMQGKSVPACSTPTFIKGVCERASKSQHKLCHWQAEAQHLAATISEDTFQQKIIFIPVHSKVTHGDLFVGRDEGGHDVAVLPKEFMDYLFAGCLWPLVSRATMLRPAYTITFSATCFIGAVIKSFIVAFGVWVVIQGHDLGEVFTDLLNVSVELPMHTDAYLFQVEEQMCYPCQGYMLFVVPHPSPPMGVPPPDELPEVQLHLFMVTIQAR
ncbi:hypothetical protein BKA83DRAFT_4128642 [Pisolithus microcarpus]|nr:hypothetical protein BKA83DRAFT_4128642 [Pisolithus microcarpus]